MRFFSSDSQAKSVPFSAESQVNKRYSHWEKAASQPPSLENIQSLNNVINRTLKYQLDISTRGVKEYWATPRETLILGQGDCEDFAIVKYYALLSTGIPTEQLHLVYAFQLPSNQRHMLLSYTPKVNEPALILDNVNWTIKPLGERRDLRGVYAFNADGIWLIDQKAQFSLSPKAKRVSLWDETERRNASEPVFR